MIHFCGGERIRLPKYDFFKLFKSFDIEIIESMTLEETVGILYTLIKDKLRIVNE